MQHCWSVTRHAVYSINEVFCGKDSCVAISFDLDHWECTRIGATWSRDNEISIPIRISKEIGAIYLLASIESPSSFTKVTSAGARGNFMLQIGKATPNDNVIGFCNIIIVSTAFLKIWDIGYIRCTTSALIETECCPPFLTGIIEWKATRHRWAC